jgi:hypothetical protein
MAETKAEQLTAEQLRREVGNVLTSWPLYRVFSYVGKGGHTPRIQRIPGTVTHSVALLPQNVLLHCSGCAQVTRWETGDCEVSLGSGLDKRRYKCRNCGQQEVVYFFYWQETADGGRLAKVGQYPALSHEAPRELAKSLDKQDVDYYTKALDCRNFSYGLGAVTYLRRIVEKRINDVLDLLAEVAGEEGTSKDVAARIQDAKNSQRAEDRLEIANMLLPDRLKGGGNNPLSHIYDVTSDAIHRKSEEECIDAFDKARAAFEYLFVQLRQEKTTKGQYLASLKVLEEKSKQIRARRDAARIEEANSESGKTTQ